MFYRIGSDQLRDVDVVEIPDESDDFSESASTNNVTLAQSYS